MALKIYVSLPMAYHQKSVRKRYDKAVEEIRKEYPDALIYGPTNIDDFDENGLDPNAPTHPWSWHLGEDIKDLLECDYIYLCKGYNPRLHGIVVFFFSFVRTGNRRRGFGEEISRA